jgi:hypothetical protein
MLGLLSPHPTHLGMEEHWIPTIVERLLLLEGNPMSFVFQTIDPPSPSPPGECVPPAFVAGREHTRRAERGLGGQYFERRETQYCPLTERISLRLQWTVKMSVAIPQVLM